MILTVMQHFVRPAPYLIACFLALMLLVGTARAQSVVPDVDIDPATAPAAPPHL